jgi:hypothetical protein
MRRTRPLNGDKGIVRSLLCQLISSLQLDSWLPVIEQGRPGAVLKKLTNAVVKSDAIVKHHAKVAIDLGEQVEPVQRCNVPIVLRKNDRGRERT